MRLAFIALLFSGAFATAADDSPIFAAKDVGELVSNSGNTGDVHYADLIKATREFDTVFVWEGTPRRNPNKPADSDSAPAKTFEIGDQAFYSTPLGLSEQETAAVSDAVLKHKENFAPWSGMKFCGGFHANYAIQWREKGVTVGQVLLCFTCEEARIYVGNGSEVVDQSGEGAV